MEHLNYKNKYLKYKHKVKQFKIQKGGACTLDNQKYTQLSAYKCPLCGYLSLNPVEIVCPIDGTNFTDGSIEGVIQDNIFVPEIKSKEKIYYPGETLPTQEQQPTTQETKININKDINKDINKIPKTEVNIMKDINTNPKINIMKDINKTQKKTSLKPIDKNGYDLANLVAEYISLEELGPLVNNIYLDTYGKIEEWDTSQVTDMSNMTQDVPLFNKDISNWDVSNVNNMSYMFRNASVFNQNISKWNVENVVTMTEMFKNAMSFNQDISGWDVDPIANMVDMFTNSGMNISDPIEYFKIMENAKFKIGDQVTVSDAKYNGNYKVKKINFSEGYFFYILENDSGTTPALSELIISLYKKVSPATPSQATPSQGTPSQATPSTTKDFKMEKLDKDSSSNLIPSKAWDRLNDTVYNKKFYKSEEDYENPIIIENIKTIIRDFLPSEGSNLFNYHTMVRILDFCFMNYTSPIKLSTIGTVDHSDNKLKDYFLSKEYKALLDSHGNGSPPTSKTANTIELDSSMLGLNQILIDFVMSNIKNGRIDFTTTLLEDFINYEANRNTLVFDNGFTNPFTFKPDNTIKIGSFSPEYKPNYLNENNFFKFLLHVCNPFNMMCIPITARKSIGFTNENFYDQIFNYLLFLICLRISLLKISPIVSYNYDKPNDGVQDQLKFFKKSGIKLNDKIDEKYKELQTIKCPASKFDNNDGFINIYPQNPQNKWDKENMSENFKDKGYYKKNNTFKIEKYEDIFYSTYFAHQFLDSRHLLTIINGYKYSPDYPKLHEAKKAIIQDIKDTLLSDIPVGQQYPVKQKQMESYQLIFLLRLIAVKIDVDKIEGC